MDNLDGNQVLKTNEKLLGDIPEQISRHARLAVLCDVVIKVYV